MDLLPAAMSVEQLQALLAGAGGGLLLPDVDADGASVDAPLPSFVIGRMPPAADGAAAAPQEPQRAPAAVSAHLPAASPAAGGSAAGAAAAAPAGAPRRRARAPARAPGGASGRRAAAPRAPPRDPRPAGAPPSSRFRGVTRHRRSGRWEAHIWVRELGRQSYLGGYQLEEHAAEAYDIVALKAHAQGLRGAKTNFDASKYADLAGVIGRMPVEELIMAVRRQSQGFARGASAFRGVTPHPSGRWEARVGVPGSRHVYLGLAHDEAGAARAYDRALVRLRGRGAATNFPLSDYAPEMAEHHRAAARALAGGPAARAAAAGGPAWERWVRGGEAAVDGLRAAGAAGGGAPPEAAPAAAAAEVEPRAALAAAVSDLDAALAAHNARAAAAAAAAEAE